MDLTRVLPHVVSGTAEAVVRQPGVPLGVVVIVVLFLLFQSRVDRRDPKLAAARVEDEQPLEFVHTLHPRSLSSV